MRVWPQRLAEEKTMPHSNSEGTHYCKLRKTLWQLHCPSPCFTVDFVLCQWPSDQDSSQLQIRLWKLKNWLRLLVSGHFMLPLLKKRDTQSQRISIWLTGTQKINFLINWSLDKGLDLTQPVTWLIQDKKLELAIGGILKTQNPKTNLMIVNNAANFPVNMQRVKCCTHVTSFNNGSKLGFNNVCLSVAPSIHNGP